MRVFGGRRRGFIVTVVLIVVAVLLLGCGLLWVAWNGTFWLIDRAVDFVPPAWETAYGESAAKDETTREIKDPVIVNAVNEIFSRLVKALPADQPYHFVIHPVWDPSENAFALPGGEVLITSALLAAARSPDEVAGVLGHESQHVLGRHAFRGMARKTGLTFALGWMLGDQGLSGMIAQGSSSLIGLKFDRNQEWEADQAGVRFAYDAGYQPRAMADFFQRQMDEAKLDPTAEHVLALLSDHPADSDRLDQIRKLAGELPPRARSTGVAMATWATVREHSAKIPPQFKQRPKENS
jgi:predicted Zn-dependent protease